MKQVDSWGALAQFYGDCFMIPVVPQPLTDFNLDHPVLDDQFLCYIQGLEEPEFFK